jgi:hypothetical protein
MPQQHMAGDVLYVDELAIVWQAVLKNPPCQGRRNYCCEICFHDHQRITPSENNCFETNTTRHTYFIQAHQHALLLQLSQATHRRARGSLSHFAAHTT